MNLSDEEKAKVLARLPEHKDHELISFELEDFLFVVKCSCGAKIKYTWQPTSVPPHIKKQFWDGKKRRWVEIHHDQQCRFQQFCTCDN